MQLNTLPPDAGIALLVKNILVFEETSNVPVTNLPFFADGYPGILYYHSESGLTVQPHDKVMPQLFIYGQTIKPIELVFHGPYRFVIFQLYPFVLKTFFGITPADVNDNCYDLQQTKEGRSVVELVSGFADSIPQISNMLLQLFQQKRSALDLQLRQAIQLIVETKGQAPLHDIIRQAHLTERTFERRFRKEVGITPKQFSQMIQFQESLQQLTMKEYKKLTDLVYDNGFADQSHFIKVFKAFTGTTPRRFSASL